MTIEKKLMDKMTPIRQMITHQKLWIEAGLSIDKWFENYQKIFIEKEKQQIIDAYQNAQIDLAKVLFPNRNLDAIKEDYEDSTNYYNETYGE